MYDNFIYKKANAMKNSTEILLQTKSSRLKEISPQNHFYTKNLDNNDFINHDYHHLYRTSYGDMSNKVKIKLNLKLKKKYFLFSQLIAL